MTEEFKNKNRIAKEQAVEELKEKISKAQSVVIADYKGLNVAEVTQLRNELRAEGIEYKVAKNTLIGLAIADMDLEDLKPHLNGPTAIAIGYEDAVAPARIISEFNKKTKKLVIKAGVCEGKYLDAAGVDALSKIPSRQGLLGQFAGAMSGVMRNFAYVLDQIAKQQGGEEAPAEEVAAE